MRTPLKRITEFLLLRSGPASVARILSSRHSLVVAYHNVVTQEEQHWGDASLHLSLDQFVTQLDLLADTHEVVPLPALLSPSRGSGRPRAAITFDDAYRGAVTLGVSELAARGLPATIFVAPSFVGGGSFWWDALADGVTGVVPESTRTHAIENLCGRDRAIRDWATAESMNVRRPPFLATAASEEELRSTCGAPGITVASHTWSHPNLARLSGQELDDELTRPLEWLRHRFANVIPWLTYPYGRTSAESAIAAANAGYQAALLITGGWMTNRTRSRFFLPRVNIAAGLSANGFALRASGLIRV